MNSKIQRNVFATYDPQYEAAGFDTIPTRGKRPVDQGWTKQRSLSPEVREQLRQKNGQCNIGLLSGTALATNKILVFLDIDLDVLVPVIRALMGNPVCAKRGGKGQTIFCQAAPGLKSAKLRPKGAKAPVVEIMADTGMTILPPSRHPNGMEYQWIGKSLLDVPQSDLPVLDEVRLAVIRFIARSPYALAIAEGGPDVKGHDLMLSLAASGIAHLTDDLEWLANCLNALFHPDYRGNTKSETLEMLRSAKEKGLGRRGTSRAYDPGEIGPVPLGYMSDGQFALRDQVRNIIVRASSGQLLSPQYLVGLAHSAFWAERFPAPKAIFNGMAAGETLMEKCRERGPFNPMTVRGRGIWREGERIVINLGGPIPGGLSHTYLCFDPITFEAADDFETERLLDFLRLFRWRDTQDAMMLLGWLAVAPICGVLDWRPHVFLYGPPRCGKTTIHASVARLLSPLVISTDGQSSEAGIRQTLGPDSLPVIIDEFESDQGGHSLRSILRLARSASSADNPVFRGTPEGKAMQFSLRTSFFFSAVNPGRMSPADQSRIVLLELLMHESKREVARKIQEEESHFRSLRQKWSGYMISKAHLIGPAVEALNQVMPSSDARHRQNMSTLLAGAFVALMGRAPTAEEAAAWAQEYQPAVARLEEDIQRDDAQECLDYLFAYTVDGYPLGHWAGIMLERPEGKAGERQLADAERITRSYDLMIHADGDHPGLFLRNGSPAIDRVFEGTIWEGRAWQRAIRKLDCAFTPTYPVHFSSTRGKSRCIGLPLEVIPEPLPTYERSLADHGEF